MSIIINFLNVIHTTQNTNSSEFGLVDDTPPPHTPAYICQNTQEKQKWIATIINVKNKDCKFLPVDNNIPILRPNGEMESRCDGILFIAEDDTKESICFVELKERNCKNKEWTQLGISQLEKTIEIFSQNHVISIYKERNAFVCNRCKPNYQYSNRQVLEEFRKKYSVSLNITTKINV